MPVYKSSSLVPIIIISLFTLRVITMTDNRFACYMFMFSTHSSIDNTITHRLTSRTNNRIVLPLLSPPIDDTICSRFYRANKLRAIRSRYVNYKLVKRRAQWQRHLVAKAGRCRWDDAGSKCDTILQCMPSGSWIYSFFFWFQYSGNKIVCFYVCWYISCWYISSKGCWHKNTSIQYFCSRWYMSQLTYVRANVWCPAFSLLHGETCCSLQRWKLGLADDIKHACFSWELKHIMMFFIYIKYCTVFC